MESDRASKLLEQVDRAPSDWRQGDICCDLGLEIVFVELSRPLDPAPLGASEQSSRASEEIYEPGVDVVGRFPRYRWAWARSAVATRCAILAQLVRRLVWMQHPPL